MAPLLEQWRSEHDGLLTELNYRNYVHPQPVPVQYRIEFLTRTPQPGEFPASFLRRELRAMRPVELGPATVTPHA